MGDEYSNPNWKNPCYGLSESDQPEEYDEGKVRYYKINKISDKSINVNIIKQSRLLDALIDDIFINIYNKSNICELDYNFKLNNNPYRSFKYEKLP